VKRNEFIRELVNAGCHLKRHGANHDIYVNPRTGRKAPIPRHSEIRDTLCRLIKKQLGLASCGPLAVSAAVVEVFTFPPGVWFSVWGWMSLIYIWLGER
jgi:hypothetical protein